MYNQELNRDKVTPSYQRWMKMVRQQIDETIRTRNFKARSERSGTGVSVKSHRGRNFQRGKKNMRLLSVEGNWTVFEKESPVVLTTGLILVNGHNHPLLLPKRRLRPAEESLLCSALHETDVSKLMYHMRINGDLLDQDLLVAFGGQLRASVSWWQATTGVTCGLGLRTSLGTALPAFVASRIMCRPLLSTMVDHSSLAFGESWQSTTRAAPTETARRSPGRT